MPASGLRALRPSPEGRTRCLVFELLEGRPAPHLAVFRLIGQRAFLASEVESCTGGRLAVRLAKRSGARQTSQCSA